MSRSRSRPGHQSTTSKSRPSSKFTSVSNSTPARSNLPRSLIQGSNNRIPTTPLSSFSPPRPSYSSVGGKGEGKKKKNKGVNGIVPHDGKEGEEFEDEEDEDSGPLYYSLLTRSLDDQVLRVYDVRTGKILSRWGSNNHDESLMPTVECLEWAWIPIVGEEADEGEGGGAGGGGVGGEKAQKKRKRNRRGSEVEGDDDDETSSPAKKIPNGIHPTTGTRREYKPVVLLGLRKRASDEEGGGMFSSKKPIGRVLKDLLILDPMTGLEVPTSTWTVSRPPQVNGTSSNDNEESFVDHGILALSTSPSSNEDGGTLLWTCSSSSASVNLWSLNFNSQNNKPSSSINFQSVAQITIPSSLTSSVSANTNRNSTASSSSSWTGITTRLLNPNLSSSSPESKPTALLALSTSSSAFVLIVSPLPISSSSSSNPKTTSNVIEALPLSTTPSNFGTLSSAEIGGGDISFGAQPPGLAFVDITSRGTEDDEGGESVGGRWGLLTIPRGGNDQSDGGDVMLWGLPSPLPSSSSASPLPLLANFSTVGEGAVEHAVISRCLCLGPSTTDSEPSEEGLIWMILTSSRSGGNNNNNNDRILTSQTSLRSLSFSTSNSKENKKKTAGPIVVRKQGEVIGSGIGGFVLAKEKEARERGTIWVVRGGTTGKTKFAKLRLRDSDKRPLAQIELDGFPGKNKADAMDVDMDDEEEDESGAAPPLRTKYFEPDTSAVRAGGNAILQNESGLVADSSSKLAADDGDLDVDMVEETLGERLRGLKGTATTGSDEDGEDQDEEEGSTSRLSSKLKGKGKAPSSSSLQSRRFLVPSSSLSQNVIQALHSSDASLLESCLSHRDPKIVRNTIKRIPPGGLVLKLLEELVDRLGRRRREGGAEGVGAQPKRGRGLVEWVRQVLTVHVGYLVTIPALVNRLAALHATLSSRLAVQNQLLSLNGRLELVMSQIELRQDAANTFAPPTTTKKNLSKTTKENLNPTTTSSSSKKQVMPRRYVEGEDDDVDDVLAAAAAEQEHDDDEGSIEDIVLGTGETDDEEEPVTMPMSSSRSRRKGRGKKSVLESDYEDEDGEGSDNDDEEEDGKEDEDPDATGVVGRLKNKLNLVDLEAEESSDEEDGDEDDDEEEEDESESEEEEGDDDEENISDLINDESEESEEDDDSD